LRDGWSDPAAALRAYEAERIPRTAGFVSLSRRVGRVGQWDNPVQVFFRNNVFAKAMVLFSNTKRAAGDLQVDY
jgi:2-polyprenyl-6-methoxyphenol hydroxylase-like FAD-dependent oxidoreductase